MAVFEPPLFAAATATAGVLGPYRELVEAGDLAAATHLFAEQVTRVPASVLAALAEAVAAPKNAEQQAAAAEAVGFLHDLEAMTADTQDVHRWAHLDAPVLLMQGGATWAPMPATMDRLADALDLAKPARVVLADQSHFATHSAPELFAGTLGRFLHRRGDDGAPDSRPRQRCRYKWLNSSSLLQRRGEQTR